MQSGQNLDPPIPFIDTTDTLSLTTSYNTKTIFRSHPYAQNLSLWFFPPHLHPTRNPRFPYSHKVTFGAASFQFVPLREEEVWAD